MTENKLYAFRTNDPKMQKHLETKNIADYLRDLVQKDMKGKIIDDTHRLKNLNLTLEIYKKLKELGVVIPKINDPFDVIIGKEELPVPNIEVLNNGSSFIPQNKKSWKHHCLALGKDVEFEIKISECKWCLQKQDAEGVIFL